MSIAATANVFRSCWFARLEAERHLAGRELRVGRVTDQEVGNWRLPAGAKSLARNIEAVGAAARGAGAAVSEGVGARMYWCF